VNGRERRLPSARAAERLHSGVGQRSKKQGRALQRRVDLPAESGEPRSASPSRLQTCPSSCQTAPLASARFAAPHSTSRPPRGVGGVSSRDNKV
jgi:hypothetical protein